MRSYETRAGGGSRPPARISRFPGGEPVEQERQEDAPSQGEAESPQAGTPKLVYLARIVAFGSLAWTLGVLMATLNDVWTSSPVPVLIAALLLSLPAAVIIAGLGLRKVQGMAVAAPAPEKVAADVRDSTTGLPGEPYFQLRLEEEVDRALRHDRPLAVVILDVNHLASVNDQYDWSCGDQVLKHLARVTEGTKRASDVVARLNDDRFGLLLPECKETGVGAFIRRLEERLAREPARAHFAGQIIMLWVGVCAGVASLGPQAREPSELLSLAEADLRVAKEHLKRRRQRWLSA